MTNKMPVVGKRYRHKDDVNTIVTPIRIETEEVQTVIFKDPYSPLDLNVFLDLYEELPTANSQETKEVQINSDQQAKIDKCDCLVLFTIS